MDREDGVAAHLRTMGWATHDVDIVNANLGGQSAEDHDLKQLSPTFAGKFLSLAVEASPWKQPHVSAVGRCQAIFASLKSGTQWLKGEMGPPISYVWGYPTAETPKQDGVCVAAFDPNLGWKVDTELMKQVDARLDCEAFQAKLNFRSW